jgi:ribosomal protein S7
MVAALAPLLATEEAASACHQALDAMSKTKEQNAIGQLAQIVALLAPRLEHREAAQETAMAMRGALSAMQKPTGTEETRSIVLAIVALAPYLEAKDARAAARQVIDVMASPGGLHLWVIYDSDSPGPISALAARLEAGEAAGVLQHALAATANTPRASNIRLVLLARAVAELAPRLDSKTAQAAARRVFKSIKTTKSTEAYEARDFAAKFPATLASLAPYLEPDEIDEVVAYVLDATCTGGILELDVLVGAFATLLLKPEAQDCSQRARFLATAVGSAGNSQSPWGGWPPLLEAARPLPARFTEQELVNFLKMPICQRAVREVLLRQLGHQCGRPFANQWGFVAWARQHRPQFDLTSPPVRRVKRP